MTHPHGAGPQHDLATWQRILSATAVLDVLAAAVEDWAPLPSPEAGWLVHTEIPEGWRTIPMTDDTQTPLRVVAMPAEGRRAWVACQSLSAFRFTGVPAPSLLYGNSSRVLEETAALRVKTDPVVLPEGRGLAGVRTEGYVHVDGRDFWVRYSTYLRGSDTEMDGLVVEEIMAASAESVLRIHGTGDLSAAARDAFIAHIGLTADHMREAVATHGERLREEAARGPVLSDEQRRFLWHALAMWGGPASGRPLPIEAIGYADWPAFDADIERIRARLSEAEPEFSALDWTRILLLAEISFGSDLLGAGVEFDIASPWRDPEALALLRSIQRALVRVVDGRLLFRGSGQKATTDS